MDIKQKVLSLSSEYFDEIKAVREHLHAHPELSFEEHKTSLYIQKKLDEFGIPYEKKWAGTGVLAVIKGKKHDSMNIALRADMDALPIQEVSNKSYKSKNDGIMHACGHDVHSACLLGAAKILHQLKEEWSGSIYLIFQPAEEKFPGGASLLIKEGLLQKIKAKKIIAQHVYPELQFGKLGFKEGMYMASADELYIKVIGKGGHAALPHKNIDPILIASQIIVGLQSIVSRFSPPTIPSVLSIGKLMAKGATNVIPDVVTMEGTFRTMDEKWRKSAHQKIQDIANNIARSYGGKVEIDIKKGYPFLINDKALTESCKNSAIELLGKENIKELELRMTAEDFAYYSQQIPACFYRLGVGNKEKNINASVHTPTFDIEERALKTGMASLAYIAIKEVSQ